MSKEDIFRALFDRAIGPMLEGKINYGWISTGHLQIDFKGVRSLKGGFLLVDPYTVDPVKGCLSLLKDILEVTCVTMDELLGIVPLEENKPEKAQNEALYHMREAAKWLAWGDGTGPDPRISMDGEAAE